MRSVCFVVVLAFHMAMLSAPAARAARHKPLRRIYHGFDDSINDFPYIVALLREAKIRICTGTLIAPKWVLVTAHCQKATHVQYGDMTLPRSNITSLSAVLKYITHPTYRALQYIKTRMQFYNDIGMALVEQTPIQNGQLSAIDYKTLTGYEVKYVGLGVRNISDKYTYNLREPRRFGHGVIAPCKDVARSLFYHPNICVASECKLPQSAMPGDSGGPLLLDQKVVGITVAVLYEPRITIFTPVSPYLSWIRKMMDEHEVV